MRYLYIISMLFLFSVACKSKKAATNTASPQKEITLSQEAIVKKLYEDCTTCKISVCKMGGKTYYSTEMNAYDVGTKVYDEKGNYFIDCGYMKKDARCALEECEIVFVPAKNIWGLKGTDKFGLVD